MVVVVDLGFGNNQMIFRSKFAKLDAVEFHSFGKVLNGLDRFAHFKLHIDQ